MARNPELTPQRRLVNQQVTVNNRQTIIGNTEPEKPFDGMIWIDTTTDPAATYTYDAETKDWGFGTLIGATIQTDTDNPKFVITATTFQAINSNGDVVFEVVLTGANEGDVIMGDDATSQYAIWDESASAFRVNGLQVGTQTFGGDGSDGILNVTSGTTNIAIQKWQYSSITVATGAILSTAGTTGAMKLLCQQDMTVTGNVNFNDKITDTTADSAFNLFGGDTFTPTGIKSEANGAGGGGAANAGGVFGGAGGQGNGGGAGGAGSGGGAGGASGSGGTTQGAGGNAGNEVSPTPVAGGVSAGGGGYRVDSTSAGAGGGAGITGGTPDGTGGGTGGTGFGSIGGVGQGSGGFKGGGGGGAGGESGQTGGVDLLINVAGDFDGTSGVIDLSGADGQAGGAGGASTTSVALGGGGGGGGNGGDAGTLRLIYGGSYTAIGTSTLTGGAGGAGGAGGIAADGNGTAGDAGTAGSNGSSTIKEIDNLY